MTQELLQAVILGIVQGLTEFLPVSSTGHLILVGDWIHFNGQQERFFDVFIQLGAILAVVFLYPRRFLGLLCFRGEGHLSDGLHGLEGIKKLGIACLPAVLVGGLFYKYIKEELFSTTTVAAALLVGAILMLLVEYSEHRVKAREVGEIQLSQALFIGIIQCLALWPGMSRSACTIVGGLLCGVERKAAAEFSFLVAVPLMCAAVAYDTYKMLPFITAHDLWQCGVGFVVSFITALLAIRVFIDLLKKITLVPFAVYRIILAGIVLAFLS